MCITRLAYYSELRSKHLPFRAFIQASASTSIITRNTTIHSIQPFKEDGTLTIPDFAGNLFFNTLGNFVLNPKAGLVFVDFSTGNLLHMTGDVGLILDSDTLSTVEGAERLWRFSPRRIVRRSNALALSWSTKPDGSSPY